MKLKLLCVALSLASLVLVQAVPQIINLQGYDVDHPSDILTVEPGGDLYLASNDASRYLKNIQITSGTSTMTLDQLSAGQKFKIQDKLHIQSTNNGQVTKSLTGLLYVTTATQATDPTFSVVVVNGGAPLVMNNMKSTTVILNTAINADFPAFDDPGKTTYVTNVKHSESVNLAFHYGVPDANWNDVTVNQFFENPQTILMSQKTGPPVNTKVFFDNVEPLQINTPYWYITADGPYLMYLDSKYMDVQTHEATAPKTTGLVVISDILLTQTINFPVDPNGPGTSGMMVSAFPQYQIDVYFDFPGSSSHQSYATTTKHFRFSTDGATTQITVNATSLIPGKFYGQYYVIGEKLAPTTPSPTTFSTTISSLITSTFFSTTRSAGSLDLLKLTVTFVMYILWKH